MKEAERLRKEMQEASIGGIDVITYNTLMNGVPARGAE